MGTSVEVAAAIGPRGGVGHQEGGRLGDLRPLVSQCQQGREEAEHPLTADRVASSVMSEITLTAVLPQ